MWGHMKTQGCHKPDRHTNEERNRVENKKRSARHWSPWKVDEILSLLEYHPSRNSDPTLGLNIPFNFPAYFGILNLMFF